jgi:hypothetical protein
LPSEVLLKADSLDVYVMDAALSYRNYQEQEHLHKQGKGDKPVPNIPVNKLEEMIKSVREKGNDKNNKNRK